MEQPEHVPLEWRGSQAHHSTSPEMAATRITEEGQASDILVETLKNRRGTVQVEYGIREFYFADCDHGFIYSWTGRDHEDVKFSNEDSHTDGRKGTWTGVVTVDLTSKFNVRRI
jgi:hypothetical protein